MVYLAREGQLSRLITSSAATLPAAFRAIANIGKMMENRYWDFTHVPVRFALY